MALAPVNYIRDWLAQEVKTIFPPQWAGGWERWAQGQIAQYMEGRDGFQVWTEQRIFRNAPAEAVDLEFRKPVGPAGVRRFIELKCYGSGNEDTALTFINSLLRDFVKVHEPLTTGNRSEPPAKGSTLWVVGIAQSQFRNYIHTTGQQSPEWQNFNMISVDTMHARPSGTTTFDIYYYSYTNNA